MVKCVLIAANYSSNGAFSKEGARQWDGDDIPTRGSLGGPKKDVLDIKESMPSSFTVQKSFEVEGHLLRKSQVVSSLQTLFASAGSWVQIVYSGHGSREGGRWCFEDSNGNICEYITFEEVLAMWRGRPQSGPSNLSIIIDACFSGAWIKKATSAWSSSDGDLTIRAACTATEVAFEDAQGGRFSQWLVSVWTRKTSSSNPMPLGRNSTQHPQVLKIVGGNVQLKTAR